MKLRCFKIKNQARILSECVNISYAAYYGDHRWNFSHSVIAVLHGFLKCFEIVISLQYLKKLPAQELNGQAFNVISTGHYVDLDFVNFLNDVDDELKSLIHVHRLDENSKLGISGPDLPQIFFIILITFSTWIKLLFSSLKGGKSFYKNYLVIKHFRADLLPELIRVRHCVKDFDLHNPIIIMFADEGNPRIQAFLRLSGVKKDQRIRLVHVQHGVVSEDTSEWSYSIADTFFVISQRTKNYLDRLFGEARKVFLTGPYVRKRFDPVVSKYASCDANNGLIILQPYVKQFGSKEDFLNLWLRVAKFCGEHPHKNWIVRMHPVQNFSKELTEIFSIKNCIFDNVTKLEAQIHQSDFVIGISSQTSYEVIASGKPLLLLRHGNMCIAENFEQDFLLHTCDVNLFIDRYKVIDYEREALKSKVTKSRDALGIAPFTHEKVRKNFLKFLKKVKQSDET